jgi:hypothetical protein
MYEYPLVASLTLSFQRYPYPPDGYVQALPRSWGALPFLADAARLTLPCLDGEAFWIGLAFSPGQPATEVSVTAVTDGGDGFEIAVAAPPEYAVAGIPRAEGGWWALTRSRRAPYVPAVLRIDLTAATEDQRVGVRVDLVEPATFVALGGPEPEPLDASRRYGGWRLP